MSEDELEFLRDQDLMEDFTDEELKAVHEVIQKKSYEYNKTIVEEGEVSTELYFVASGEVSLFKWDDDQTHLLPLGRLQEGGMFGEMAFLDQEPRAATIKTAKDSELWTLSREDVDQQLKQKHPDALNKLLVNIAKININRLRDSNVSYMKNLRSGLRRLQVRIDVGEFIMALILMLFAILFVDYKFVKSLFDNAFAVIDWTFWALAFLPTIFLVKSYHLYADEIGLLVKKPLRILRDSAAIILVGIIGIVILTSIYKYLYAELVGQPVQRTPIQESMMLFAPLYFIYCAIFEFICRGVLQSTIQRFLDRPSPWWAIIYTALFVGLLQAPFSLEVGAIGFLASLFLGWIYCWQNSLMGVILIHFCLGLFMLYWNT